MTVSWLETRATLRGSRCSTPRPRVASVMPGGNAHAFQNRPHRRSTHGDAGDLAPRGLGAAVARGLGRAGLSPPDRRRAEVARLRAARDLLHPAPEGAGGG